MLWLGIGVGLWYLTILAMILMGLAPRGWIKWKAAYIVLAAIGVLTIGGCINRLRQPASGG